MKLVDDFCNICLYHGDKDDFLSEDTTRWTTTATHSGATTCADAAGGIIALIPSDGTVADNDEIYLYTANEIIKFADDNPVAIEACVQFTEANTDDANILFGLMDAPGADSLLSNGGGPKASYSGAVFFKVDGGTVWQCENSIAGTQKTTELTAANSLTKDAVTAGGAAYQTLRIVSQPMTSTRHDVSFFVDNVLVAKHKDQSLSSATEMKIVFGCRNGGANLETLNVDYVAYAQKR